VLFVASACGEGVVDIDGSSSQTEEARQKLIVDDVFNKLKEIEGLMPTPPPSAEVVIGTLNASTGEFTGLTSDWELDPITQKPRKRPAATTVKAVDMIAVFSAIGSSSLTVTANGQTVTSDTGTVRINIGKANVMQWTARSGSASYSDSLRISRPAVIGAGAFTIAALPVTVIYEPPMNQAKTNFSSMQFRQQMTTITTVSDGRSSTSTKPVWATGMVMKDILGRLAKSGVTPAAVLTDALNRGATLMGKVDWTTTRGTTVNSDSSLGVSSEHSTTVTTNGKLGPGLGDVVVFFKDARVLWGMEQGKVTLTMLDHGPEFAVPIETLKNDLVAVRAQGVAPVTGLDAPTLESLIKLSPMANLPSISPTSPGRGLTDVRLPQPRFSHEKTLTLSGSKYDDSVSHTISQTDKTATLNTTSSVRNVTPGWLSLIGLGLGEAGTFTSTLSMGSSRSDQVSNTVTARFFLEAAVGESYSVQVHYDAVFGSFLTRLPPKPVVIGPIIIR
jgi:hypothetical protein